MRGWLGGPLNTSSWPSLDRIYSVTSILSSPLLRCAKKFRAASLGRLPGRSNSHEEWGSVNIRNKTLDGNVVKSMTTIRMDVLRRHNCLPIQGITAVL